MSILEVILPLLLLAASCRANPIFGTIVSPQKEEPTNITYRLPRDVVPVEYDITLEPEIEKDFTFSGYSEITVSVVKSNNTIYLHAKDLEIDGEIWLETVKQDRKKKSIDDWLNNGNTSNKDAPDKTTPDKVPKENTGVNVTPIRLKAQKYVIDTLRDFLIITFEKPLPIGTYKLSLKYNGVLNDELYGFYRSSYLDKNKEKRWLATTHFEPVGARRAFPCWDEPEFKTPFKISIRHLREYTAISNMREEAPIQLAGDARRVVTKFNATPPMSTYLVAFVVSDYGKIETTNGVQRVWTKKHALDQAEYALDIGEKTLKELDDYTDIAFFKTMPKMDQISIPDFEAGAMENWGLVTYRETALLYEKGVTTANSQQSIATIISHEFAHQWFGNLVSPKWWKYLWLNEGFATYFQYYTTDKIFEDWRLMEQMAVKAMQGSAFIQDATENTRPLNGDAQTPTQIRGLFDTIAYQKAGCVIRMMSHFLTEKVFKDGLRIYLNTNKYGSATSDELFTALQKAAEKSDKFDKDFNMHKIMDEWVNKEGYPTVYVSRNADNGKLTVNQTRYIVTQAKDDTKWWIPLNYVSQDKIDFSDTGVTEWLKPKDKSIEISGIKKTDWVIFNKQQTGYYRVNYDENNWDLIRKFLETDKYVEIHTLNRAQLIDDAFSLAQIGELSYPVALSLTSYLDAEVDYIPWVPAFRAFDFLNNMLATSKQHHKFLEYVQSKVKRLAENVTYEAKDSDSHILKLNRINALRWACASGLKQCNDYVNKKLTAWLDDSKKNPLDVDLKANILCAGLRNADGNTWEKALKKYSDIEDATEKMYLLQALGCSESEDILKKFLSSSLEKSSPVKDFNDIFSAVLNGTPKGFLFVLDALIDNYDRIKELDPPGKRTKMLITQIGSRITESSDYVKLGLFIAKRGLSAEISNTGLQNAGKNVDWANTYKQGIEEWFVVATKPSSASSVSFATFLVIIPILLARLL